MMIVQVYALTNADDVRALVELEVDHIGFAIQVPPAGITVERARELFKLVPPELNTAALTTETEVDAIVEVAEAVQPDVLHIASEMHAVSPRELRAIKDEVSSPVSIEKSIDVTEPNPIEAAQRFDDVSDFLLLDSNSDEVTGIGASGETHDWSVSKRIIKEVETPAILAGGLDPDNVADAIRTVQPQGVDSFTRTSKTYERKDIAAVEEFVEEARTAGEQRT